MLREIVRPYNGIVIDPLAQQWVSPERAPSLLYSDGIHPSEVGHAYIAMRLAADLKNAGLDNLRASDQPPS
jgi:lysophospholipase L1-like esterase